MHTVDSHPDSVNAGGGLLFSRIRLGEGNIPGSFFPGTDACLGQTQLLVWNVDALSKGLCLPVQSRSGHKDKVASPDPRATCFFTLHPKNQVVRLEGQAST